MKALPENEVPLLNSKTFNFLLLPEKYQYFAIKASHKVKYDCHKQIISRVLRVIKSRASRIILGTFYRDRACIHDLRGKS